MTLFCPNCMDAVAVARWATEPVVCASCGVSCRFVHECTWDGETEECYEYLEQVKSPPAASPSA